MAHQTTTDSSPKSNSSMISELSIQASASSSSACSITTSNATAVKSNLNLINETDSGRHSMSDSPTQNSQKETKIYLLKNNNKSAAGTFTSKVTSSGMPEYNVCFMCVYFLFFILKQKQGTSVTTLAQTVQNLEKQQNNQNYAKKRASRDYQPNNQQMTKSSSFCRVPILQNTVSASNLKNNRSHSSNSRANNNNNNSNLSVNRNCSEL